MAGGIGLCTLTEGGSKLLGSRLFLLSSNKQIKIPSELKENQRGINEKNSSSKGI